MFWIYIPPIIFVTALIFLAVIFGKKTAILKKRGEIFQTDSQPQTFSTDPKKSGRLKTFWLILLKFLEKVVSLIKIGTRKTEESLSKILHKMKEKRLEKKISEPLKENTSGDIFFESENTVQNIDLIAGKTERKMPGKIQRAAFTSGEVIVRKKEEPAPQRIVPELATEDKAKEEALIHRIAENPKDIEAYRELGDYYLSIGNIKDAKDSFKMVLKLRPRDLKAKSSLREIEMRMRLKS